MAVLTRALKKTCTWGEHVLVRVHQECRGWLENEANFCTLCSYLDQQMSLHLIYIYILWHLQSLPRLLMWSSGCHGGCSALRVSHFQCLKAWLEGQLKVDAMMFDLRVANGCVDVAERDYCRRLLTVTLLMTRGSTTKLKLWHHYRKNSSKHDRSWETEVSVSLCAVINQELCEPSSI